MIRSTKHYFLQHTNIGKIEILHQFLAEYRSAVQFYIDYIWDNEFYFQDNDTVQFSISKDLLFVPKYIDYSVLQNTKLSARALANALKQALGIVRGRVAIRKKTKYIIQKRKEEKLPTEKWETKLTKGQCVLKKPEIKEEFCAELNKNVFDIEEGKNHFDLFVRLLSTGYGQIKIPIIYTSRDAKWKSKGGALLNGILINQNNLQLRYEVPEPVKRATGQVLGGDTGKNTVLMLSNGISTPTTDKHGHSLDSIMKELARKEKGSKSFKKKQNHRDNFIKWSINQINFNNIKLIKLEHIDNLFYNNSTSRFMSHFTNATIEGKILCLLEEIGVSISLQPSAFFSQRCSGCGKVRKANRKGKLYSCDNCHLQIDADLNSAINHEIDLPDIPNALRLSKINRTGFFWKLDGFYDLTGRELLVLGA